jgi:hypothetical protein
MKYECHITVLSKDGPAAEQVARALHWKTSEIARDPVLGKDTYFYLTSHGNEFEKIQSRAAEATNALRSIGVHVLRMKIEEIVIDVRYPVVEVMEAVHGGLTQCDMHEDESY